MGLCHEFGTQIREGCGHPMEAGQTSCSCPECGVVCAGLFEGCPDVWQRGPRPVVVAVKPDDVVNGATPLLEPVAFATAGPAVRRVREEETERIVAAEPERGPIDPDAVRRANAARVEAVHAQPDRRTAAKAEADRAAADTGAGDDAPAADEPARDAAPGMGTTGEGQTGTGTGSTGAGTEPAANGPSAGGRTVNGSRAALGAGTASAPADPRSDVLRWFDEAFAGLRRDVRELASGMTHQQAMIAELMDARQADLRLVVVAEGLPDVVQDAVEAAVADSTRGLADTFERALRELRQSVQITQSASAEAVAELRRALEASERSAAAARDEARRLRDEAEQREELRARALKAAFTRQLKPLAETAQQAAEASDRRMDEIVALLDAMAEALMSPDRPAAKKAAAPKRAAPAKKAPAKKAATKKAATGRGAAAAARPARPAPRKRVLAPAPEPTPLRSRRQPLRGLAPLEERR